MTPDALHCSAAGASMQSDEVSMDLAGVVFCFQQQVEVEKAKEEDE